MPRGYTLQGEALDDAVQGVHNPEQGAANVRGFISDAAVLAVVGPYNSNVARAESLAASSVPLPRSASATSLPRQRKVPSAFAENFAPSR